MNKMRMKTLGTDQMADNRSQEKSDGQIMSYRNAMMHLMMYIFIQKAVHVMNKSACTLHTRAHAHCTLDYSSQFRQALRSSRSGIKSQGEGSSKTTAV